MLTKIVSVSLVIWANAFTHPSVGTILVAWIVFFIWAFVVDCVLWILGFGPKK